MMIDAELLISEFRADAAEARIEGWPCPLRWETLPAPHEKPALPAGEAAISVFAASATYGRGARCGTATVLKVGKVGPNNRRRFRHSHYVAEARTISTLAQSHFFPPGDRAQLRAALEIYIRARVGSVFEGVSIGRRRTAGLMNEY